MVGVGSDGCRSGARSRRPAPRPSACEEVQAIDFSGSGCGVLTRAHALVRGDDRADARRQPGRRAAWQRRSPGWRRDRAGVSPAITACRKSIGCTRVGSRGTAERLGRQRHAVVQIGGELVSSRRSEPAPQRVTSLRRSRSSPGPRSCSAIQERHYLVVLIEVVQARYALQPAIQRSLVLLHTSLNFFSHRSRPRLLNRAPPPRQLVDSPLQVGRSSSSASELGAAQSSPLTALAVSLQPHEFVVGRAVAHGVVEAISSPAESRRIADQGGRLTAQDRNSDRTVVHPVGGAVATSCGPQFLLDLQGQQALRG